MGRWWIWLVLAASLSAMAGCRGRPPPPSLDGGPEADCEGQPDGWLCFGAEALLCEEGDVQMRSDCAGEDRRCVPGLGCRRCRPGELGCDGERLLQCEADGSGFREEFVCEAGTQCSAMGCADLCARAEEESSYIGCEYWPVTTLNNQLPDEFDFAVVVTNPQLIDVEVVVERGGDVVRRATLAPGALETIRLPWERRLQRATGSTLVRGGAYRLTSSAPVTVHQLNPLDFEIPRDCEADPDSGGRGRCYSFTNDASLLLPSHVASGSYVAHSWPTLGLEVEGERLSSSGFVAVVAVDDEVELELSSRAALEPSDEGSDADIEALGPGERATFTLRRGDVLQLASARPATCPGEEVAETGGLDAVYCDGGPGLDLTGSELRASGRVLVIGGHDCAFVPFDRWACDHLETSLFPLEAWGREVVVAPTRPIRSEPNIVRILSGADGNALTFEPALFAPRTLDRGDYAELVVRQPFVVRAEGPIAVAQYLVGQDYAGLGSAGGAAVGDPSLAVIVPREQYRRSYHFLAPRSYRSSFATVVAPEGAVVSLNGRALSGGSAIEGTGLATQHVVLTGGAHRMESDRLFGVLVYGFGTYTSYLYPAGLDLHFITPPL